MHMNKEVFCNEKHYKCYCCYINQHNYVMMLNVKKKQTFVCYTSKSFSRPFLNSNIYIYYTVMTKIYEQFKKKKIYLSFPLVT